LVDSVESGFFVVPVIHTRTAG